MAIQNLEKALQIAPGDVVLNAKLAEARYNSGMEDGQAAFNARRFQDALAYYQQALSAKPGDPTAMTRVQFTQNLLRGPKP